MPATSIRSGWSSGSLIFHDKTVAAPKTGYNILTIGTSAVTIGDGTKDIDFKWYGTSSDSFILDAGAHTLTMAGLNVSLSGDIALTAEDLSLIDDQDLEFGTGTDVLMRWSTADDSDHAFVIALGDTSQQMHITDKGAVATDWIRDAGTHPELSIHSNTTPATDYLAIGNHDGTTAHINVVGGTTLSLDIGGTAEYTFTATAVDFNDNNITELGDVTPSDGSIIAAIDGAGTTLLLKAGGLTGTTFITLTSQSAGTDTMTLGALTLGGAITGGSQNMTGMGTINGLAITANTGAITTGTWTATVITPVYGGTGIANNVASTLTISGAFGTTFTVSNTTSLVLPTTGTVATLAGTEEFDNKTLDSSVGKGTWTASGTWTLPAHTMASTLTFSGGSAYIPIQAGTKDNTAGAGFKISSASADNSGGVQLYADDGGSALASPAEVVTPFRSRYLVTAAQSGGVTQTATFSQLRTLGTTGEPLILNTGIWESAYIFAQLGGNTIQGGAKIMGINQATTLAGNMIVTSGEFAGIDVNIAGTGGITNNSTCAGLIIRSSGTPVWPNGIQIANSGAVTGINVGTCSTLGLNIGRSSPRGLLIGLPYAGGGTSTGMKVLTDGTTYTAGAPVGFYFDDGGSALTAFGECFTVGQAVLTASQGSGQTGWPYTAFFYLDIEADITTAATQHWANVMTSAIIGTGKVVDGFTNHGISSLHTSCDINGTLSASNTMSNISFGGNATGTVAGDWVCMHIRDTTGNFTAWTKFDTNATGCYTAAYSGNDAFVPNNKGTFTQAGQIRIMVGANTFYIPYGTVA